MAYKTEEIHYVVIIDDILEKYDSTTIFDKVSQVASIKWMSLNTEDKSVMIRFDNDQEAMILSELGAITIGGEKFNLRLGEVH